MGDRYYLTVTCPYCGKQEDGFYYAPTCGFSTLQCDGCKKISVMIDMCLTKVEDATAEQITENEINALNMWTPNKEQEKSMLEENENMLETWRKLNAKVVPQKV